MIKNIKVNLELMELFYYYWKASSEKEKVGERFIYSVIEHEHMKPLYQENFTQEMARQVLSAISNRELFKPPSKESARFWNNNMWMMEDLKLTEGMFSPIKGLNLDHFINNSNLDQVQSDVEIIFIPGHLEILYKNSNQLFINFFKLMTDFIDGTVTIENLPLQEFIEIKLKDLLCI